MYTILGMDINLVAVLVATIVGMVIGALWYGPLFGKQWAALLGMKFQDMGKENMSLAYGVSALAAFGMALMLNVIFFLANITALLEGVGLAALVGLFFMMIVDWHHAIFAGRSWKLVLIDSGKDFVVLLAQAAILLLMM